MEENSNYTYTYKRQSKKSEERLKLIFAVMIIVFLILSIVLGIVFGKHRGNDKVKKQAEQTTVPETVTEPVTTEPASLYKEGDYVIKTGGYALTFRKDHAKTADAILEIADGTSLSITEIFRDESPEAKGTDTEYWGKTTYYGHTGWVAMKYLQSVYSENIITPEEVSTAKEETESAATVSETAASSESTTAASSEPGTASQSAETTTVSSTQTKYKPGDYTVETGGSSLRFKKTAGKDGKVIMSISDGTKITVTKIVETPSSDEVYRYWGEISYLGYTGYVSMAYLKPAQ